MDVLSIYPGGHKETHSRNNTALVLVGHDFVQHKADTLGNDGVMRKPPLGSVAHVRRARRNQLLHKLCGSDGKDDGGLTNVT